MVYGGGGSVEIGMGATVGSASGEPDAAAEPEAVLLPAIFGGMGGGEPALGLGANAISAGVKGAGAAPTFA